MVTCEVSNALYQMVLHGKLSTQIIVHTYVLLLLSRSSSMISERHRLNSEYGPWVLILQTQSIHGKRPIM